VATIGMAATPAIMERRVVVMVVIASPSL
jgi:hypothetical protein